MREPDLQGGPVRAWRIAQTDAVRQAHIDSFGYPDAGIDTWIVNGPFHPFWSWWHVGVVHLRDIPNCPPAQKKYPEAEYEFTVFTLDPDPGRGAIPNGCTRRTSTWLKQAIRCTGCRAS